MSVGTYALTSVDATKSYIGHDIRKNAFWIYYSGSASTAYVQVDNDTLKLKHNNNSDASLTLTAAAYDTVGELVAYINASVSNWEAGILCSSSADSADLLETGELNALGQDNEQTLEIADDYLIECLIDRSTDFLERYCNRLLKSRTLTNEQYAGNGRQRLVLDNYPVTRVVRVGEGRTNAFSIRNTSSDMNFATVEITPSTLRTVVDGGTNADDSEFTLADYASVDALITAIEALSKGWDCTAIANDTGDRDADELLPRPSMYVDSTRYAYCEYPNEFLTDYRLLKPTSTTRNEGMLQRPGGWTAGTEYFVTYTAGFTTIPSALEEACIRLVQLKYNQSKADPTMKSEKMGDYSYTRSDLDKALPQDLKDEIDLFKARII